MKQVFESLKEELLINNRKPVRSADNTLQPLLTPDEVGVSNQSDLVKLASAQRWEVMEQLHDRYGNMAVQRMFAEDNDLSTEDKPSNLSLNAIDDQYEQEADSIAKQVVGKIDDPIFQEKIKDTDQLNRITPKVQRKRAMTDGDLRQGGTISANVAGKIENARSGGESLPTKQRLVMEAAFGTDFSGVRIHRDEKANQLSQTLNASAFTIGSDIFFKKDSYQPNKKAGNELLAHELTHVIQQREQVAARQEVEKVDFEDDPEQVMGVRGTFVNTVITSMNFASNRAKINAGEFADQVRAACTAFQSYSNGQIAEFENELTAFDLAVSLGSIASIVIGSGVSAKIVSPIGKAFFNAIRGEITSKVKQKLNESQSSESDADTLKSVVSQMVQGAMDATLSVRDLVSKVLDPIVQDINYKVTSGEKLSETENDIVGSLYGSPTTSIDEYLESYLGVPSSSSATEMHIELFQKLVEEFEKRLIAIRASMRESLEMHFAEMFGEEEKTLDYKARQKAEAATQERRQAIESASQDSILRNLIQPGE